MSDPILVCTHSDALGAYPARAQQNRCRHRLWRHVLLHVAFVRRRTEKLSDDLSTLKLINDNNNKLGATWNLSIYDCGCSKSIVDVLSVRDNGFSRSYWSFFIGVPFARKIAQVSRLSCKYFFIHRSKVRGLQVCSTLRPCHVLLDRWGSSDLWPLRLALGWVEKTIDGSWLGWIPTYQSLVAIFPSWFIRQEAISRLFSNPKKGRVWLVDVVVVC